MTGLFAAPRRIVRNGKLVAFKGELMSIERAKELGIYEEPEKPAEKKPAAKKRAPRKRAPKKQAETEE